MSADSRLDDVWQDDFLGPPVPEHSPMPDASVMGAFSQLFLNKILQELDMVLDTAGCPGERPHVYLEDSL